MKRRLPAVRALTGYGFTVKSGYLYLYRYRQSEKREHYLGLVTAETKAKAQQLLDAWYREASAALQAKQRILLERLAAC